MELPIERIDLLLIATLARFVPGSLINKYFLDSQQALGLLKRKGVKSQVWVAIKLFS